MHSLLLSIVTRKDHFLAHILESPLLIWIRMQQSLMQLKNLTPLQVWISNWSLEWTILGKNAWADSINAPNKSVQSIEFEAVKKFDSSFSQDNYRNGLTENHWWPLTLKSPQSSKCMTIKDHQNTRQKTRAILSPILLIVIVVGNKIYSNQSMANQPSNMLVWMVLNLSANHYLVFKGTDIFSTILYGPYNKKYISSNAQMECPIQNAFKCQ